MPIEKGGAELHKSVSQQHTLYLTMEILPSSHSFFEHPTPGPRMTVENPAASPFAFYKTQFTQYTVNNRDRRNAAPVKLLTPHHPFDAGTFVTPFAFALNGSLHTTVLHP